MREQESFRAALVRELPDKSKGTVILFGRYFGSEVLFGSSSETKQTATYVQHMLFVLALSSRRLQNSGRSVVNEVRCGANACMAILTVKLWGNRCMFQDVRR